MNKLIYLFIFILTPHMVAAEYVVEGNKYIFFPDDGGMAGTIVEQNSNGPNAKVNVYSQWTVAGSCGKTKYIGQRWAEKELMWSCRDALEVAKKKRRNTIQAIKCFCR